LGEGIGIVGAKSYGKTTLLDLPVSCRQHDESGLELYVRLSCTGR
jgi:ATPase subunit of ABC transporter with duplicated ATPase domains